MHKVLIGISIDAVGIARLPQVLAEAGCEVTVVCGPGLAATSSRFVAEHVRTGRSPHQVRQGLEDHAAKYPGVYSWALVADEPLLRTFLQTPATPELAKLAPVTAEPQKLARLLSKTAFNQDAEKAGIP